MFNKKLFWFVLYEPLVVGETCLQFEIGLLSRLRRTDISMLKAQEEETKKYTMSVFATGNVR